MRTSSILRSLIQVSSRISDLKVYQVAICNCDIPVTEASGPYCCAIAIDYSATALHVIYLRRTLFCTFISVKHSAFLVGYLWR
jgi:hypothetical protein